MALNKFDVESGEINLFAEKYAESYQKIGTKEYFKTIEATCIRYQIRYVPVSVGENFEKILLTFG